ncbi:oxygenase MpaB family protein [Nocardia terpenica]|nr:oxygenase MpaB family protein [Nocardia terpenica]
MTTYTDMLALKPLGDPLADQVTAQLLDSGQVASTNHLFRLVTTADHDIPEGAPPVLRDYLAETRSFPEWTDWDRIRNIDAFFQYHQQASRAVLGTAGLVGTYLNPMGAKTLHATHSLDHPKRRLMQSSRLFVGMADKDAFTEHYSRLIPTCQKVRLVHSMIRQLQMRSGKWDAESDGMPVSQLYMYVATLIFSVEMLDAMDRIGIHPSPTERDGYYYAWRLIAHWLGVPEEPVPFPDTVDEATALWHSARDAGEWAATDAGTVLTLDCIDLYEQHLPRGTKGLVPAFLRLTLTDRFADMVHIPHSGYQFGTEMAAKVGGILSAQHAGRSLLVHEALKRIAEAASGVHHHAERTVVPYTEETEPQMSDHLGPIE